MVSRPDGGCPCGERLSLPITVYRAPGREQSEGAGALDPPARRLVPSLAYRFLTWVLTVFGETDSSRAISGAVRLVGR